MDAAVKHPVPHLVKPSFVIFDIRALKNKRHTYTNTYIYKLPHRLQLNEPECGLTHNLRSNDQLESYSTIVI